MYVCVCFSFRFCVFGGAKCDVEKIGNSSEFEKVNFVRFVINMLTNSFIIDIWKKNFA